MVHSRTLALQTSSAPSHGRLAVMLRTPRVVQVHVVNRHGDRTPLFNSHSGSTLEDNEESRLSDSAMYAACRTRCVYVYA